MLKHFSFNKPSSALEDGENVAWIAINVLIKSQEKRENIYTKKGHITIQSAFYFEKWKNYQNIFEKKIAAFISIIYFHIYVL